MQNFMKTFCIITALVVNSVTSQDTSTDSTSTTVSTTTSSPLPPVCGPDPCPGYLYHIYEDMASGAIVFPSGKMFCLSMVTNPPLLQYCDDSNGAENATFSLVTSMATVTDIGCYGQLNFTLRGSQFRMVGSTLCQVASNGVDCASTSLSLDDVRWYFARLRPTEASGYLYCTHYMSTSVTPTVYSPTAPMAYMYNGGTFFDLSTDAGGHLLTKSQKIPQYSRVYNVIMRDFFDCAPICCWTVDYFFPDGETEPQKKEYVFDGKSWNVWYLLYGFPSYIGYNGEVVEAMMPCLSQLNDLKWTHSDGVRYGYINGSIYKLDAATSLPIVSTPVTPTFDIATSIDADPLAEGGYFWFSGSSQTGRYRDSKGLWWVQIQNGNVNRNAKHAPPPCDAGLGNVPSFGGNAISSPTVAYTNTTLPDLLSVSMIIPCNPTAGSGVCGEGFSCTTLPTIFGLSCQMGVCLPDFSILCPSTAAPTGTSPTTTTTLSTTTPTTTTTSTTTTSTTTTSTSTTTTSAFTGSTDSTASTDTTTTTTADTTTTTTPTTTSTSTTTTSTATTTPSTTGPPAPKAAKQKYGADCYYDSDCFTGICTSRKCSCPANLKVLPMVSYNWRSSATVYAERCIPASASIRTLGEPCNIYSSARENECGLGLICAKCPEVWTSIYANATCVSVNAYSTVPCSPMFKCGYQAFCKKIGAGSPVATCMCPANYTLESNLLDCYGWTNYTASPCSAECGVGTKTLSRSCDRAPTSTAQCIGEVNITVTCLGPKGQCALNETMSQAAVKIRIKTKVITVDLFEKYVQEKLATKTAAILSKQCASDNTTFETQCCVGKRWPFATDPAPSSSNSTADNATTPAPTTVSLPGGKIAEDCVSTAWGVQFINKYADGETFSTYVIAKGDSSSSCCINAPNKPSTATTAKPASGRKRRATTGQDASGYFDQAALLSVFSATNYDEIVAASVKQYDVNAVVEKPAAVVYIPPITEPYYATPAPATATGSIGGFPLWAIGVAAGVGGTLLIGGVIVAVILAKKNKKKFPANKVSAGSIPRPTLEERNSASKATLSAIPSSRPPPKKVNRKGNDDETTDNIQAVNYGGGGQAIPQMVPAGGQPEPQDMMMHPPPMMMMQQDQMMMYNNGMMQQQQQQPMLNMEGVGLAPDYSCYPPYYGNYPPQNTNNVPYPQGAYGY